MGCVDWRRASTPCPQRTPPLTASPCIMYRRRRATVTNDKLIQLLRPVSVRLARLKGTGLPRVSAWLARYFRQRWTGGEVSITDFRGQFRIDVDPRDEMGSQILWFDSYSEVELNLLPSLLQPGDTFIDIGANIGEFALTAAGLVGPHGKVIAIEPMPQMLEKLTRHVGANGLGNVSLVGEAVGSSEGSVALFAPSPQSTEMHTGLTTRYQTDDRSTKVAQVAMTTIDTLADRLALTKVTGIKIDIEGGELDAFQGAMQSLRDFRPWILCEIGKNTCDAAGYPPSALLDLLFSLNYRVTDVADGREIKSAAELRDWQNVLAVRRDTTENE